MIILVNSMSRNTGTSVISYMLTKMYGNKMNQPALLISIKTAEFFQSAISIDPKWVAQPSQMVLNKTHSKNSFKPFCYKLEDTVYYYHAMNANLNTQMAIRDLDLLLKKANKDFGIVVVDLDCETGGFVKLIPAADVILLTTSTDVYALKDIKRQMDTIKSDYRLQKGIDIKPPIFYIINKMDANIMTLLQASKLLGVPASQVFGVDYTLDLARSRNARRLDFYTADMLSSPKNHQVKLMSIHLTKLLDTIKRSRN